MLIRDRRIGLGGSDVDGLVCSVQATASLARQTGGVVTVTFKGTYAIIIFKRPKYNEISN